ncbi:hypothetical protein HMJ29_11430 [Hymenobacter taeanensis]|uniref:NERD domain-containing protein n=1 Tax=Hymenobacter taeanensis TaxID=2735321 RepID=A0A6M6BH13_9BACT|nr:MULTISPECIES: hypothetical protein [Hymenobacter]QJX47517.1 hypothetical protein HMJ29_11430 [Hymenobacter taeanensis]UOQ82999.1 hypothetical protein MUN83_09665 [Hymenobacter sp. 5414T-23]
MLHSLLYTPFADAARQAQYEAVRAALLADTAPTTALLLGNFEVEGEVIDALVVRPHSITVLLFVPEGGLLEISTQPDAAWQLGPYTLHGDEHAANPFEQFLHQQEAVATWLTAQLPRISILPEYITGIVLFAETVQFGPSVEAYLRRQPGAENFQLLGATTQLPRRLRQLGHSALNFSEDELLTWAHDLATSAAAGSAPEETPEAGFWEQKARQLWYWLGAVDIPEDAPYGAPAEAVVAGQQEMQRLEQLSQQVHTELNAQRQAMEAREAEREQSIAQLRAQLEQAPSAAAEAAELRARLQQESQEKAALEEAIKAARTEADARNRELDTRIQQLGQLIEQMQQRPLTPPAAAPAVVAPASSAKPVVAPAGMPTATPKPAAAARPKAAAPQRQPQTPPALHGLRRQTVHLRLPRVALVVAVLVCVALAGWGIVRWSGKLLRETTPTPAHTVSRPEYQPEADTDEAEATPPTIDDIQPDTIDLTTEGRSLPEPVAPRVTTETITPESDSAETTEAPAEAEPADSVGSSGPIAP